MSTNGSIAASGSRSYAPSPECVGATRGHKSYGLGKLCELYGIELETHHRALCDARATGHLLNLMNLKRECSEPDRADKAA
jgi:DNA polymerase-3 subunit epsilon